jgi:hypothetical protein
MLCLLSTTLLPMAMGESSLSWVELSDRMWAYSATATGDITSLTSHTIGIPSGTATNKAVYPFAVTITSTLPTVVTIRVSGNDPNSSAASFNNPSSPSVAPMNGGSQPAFRFYPVSDVGLGAFVVQYPIPANDPRTIEFNGARLATGGGARRNISVHFSATPGATGTVVWSVFQSK